MTANSAFAGLAFLCVGEEGGFDLADFGILNQYDQIVRIMIHGLMGKG